MTPTAPARALRAAVAALALVAPLVAGCTVPSDDDDGPHPLPPVSPKSSSPRPLVIDTDLGRDDLAAIAVLARHPEVDLVGVTIAATGLVGCADARRVLGSLFARAGVTPPVTACGSADAGPDGRSFPEQWRREAATGFGLTGGSPVPESPLPAARLLSTLAAEHDHLEVVALGPATNLAAFRAEHPRRYAGLATVHLLAGTLDAPEADGVAEWNAAADPSALDDVLAQPSGPEAGPAITVVPADAVPSGTPAALAESGVGGTDGSGFDTWWDLGLAAAFLVDLPRTTGTWRATPDGRLERSGPGSVALVDTVPLATMAQVCTATLA